MRLIFSGLHNFSMCKEKEWRIECLSHSFKKFEKKNIKFPKLKLLYKCLMMLVWIKMPNRDTLVL